MHSTQRYDEYSPALRYYDTMVISHFSLESVELANQCLLSHSIHLQYLAKSNTLLTRHIGHVVSITVGCDMESSLIWVVGRECIQKVYCTFDKSEICINFFSLW